MRSQRSGGSVSLFYDRLPSTPSRDCWTLHFRPYRCRPSKAHLSSLDEIDKTRGENAYQVKGGKYSKVAKQLLRKMIVKSTFQEYPL
jgi:hypothetical protein